MMGRGIDFRGAGGGGSGGGIRKVADSIERLALTPSDGDFVIQLDTDELWYWDGSQWILYADDTDHADLMTVISDLASHIADTTDAHDASAISVVPTGNLAADDVQEALQEHQGDIDTLNTGLSNHLSDTTDAHDASAISVVPTGNLAADDVQEALQEHQGDIDVLITAISDHLTDTTDAHDASAISVVPTGNLAADDVQEALQEHQTDIDGLDSRLDALELIDHVAMTLAAFGSAPNANGLSVSGTDSQTLNMQPASETFPGGVSTAAQVFGGEKRFPGGVKVGSNAALAASAIFEILSTTQGWLAPRMTTTQRDAISSPATGLAIFNTTTGRPEYYDGTVWQAGDGSYTVFGTPQSLSAAGTITASQHRRQVRYVSGNGSAVSADTTTAITNPIYVGQELQIVGDSDTNTVTINNSGNAALNGSCTLGAGDVLNLYAVSTTQWREVSRSA